MVSEKMVGIDVDLFNNAAQAELNGAPVISGSAAAPAFPAVHPFAVIGVFVGNENSAPGFEKILFFREKFVVREKGHAADAFGGEIDEAGGRGCFIRGIHNTIPDLNRGFRGLTRIFSEL